jgi:hypothetical protein
VQVVPTELLTARDGATYLPEEDGFDRGEVPAGGGEERVDVRVVVARPVGVSMREECRPEPFLQGSLRGLDRDRQRVSLRHHTTSREVPDARPVTSDRLHRV